MTILFRRALLVGVVALLLGGCATYSDNMRAAHTAVKQGQNQQAVALLNQQLETPSRARLPVDFDGEKPLVLLERATVLQALGEHELAARDMMAVDDKLEYLDLTTADNVQIGKWLYSGSAQVYRAPPYERLLLNSLNMVNFLALGNVQAAKVEARRFSLLEYFFIQKSEREVMGGILGLGNYLGGVAFEASDDYATAARYYGRALYFGVADPGLRDRVIDLFAMTGHTPTELQNDDPGALADVMAQVKTTPPPSFDDYEVRWRLGDTLLLVQSGFVPYKEAKRLPLADALAYQSQHGGGAAMDEAIMTDAQVMMASGVLNTVNFPMLTRVGIPVERQVSLQVGPHEVEGFGYLNVANQVEAAWTQIAGSLMAAAITRMVTRQVAGAAAEAVTGAVADNFDPTGGLLAPIIGLATKGAMSAADTPDTRSWMLLPGEIRLSRLQLPREDFTITVRVDGLSEQKSLTVEENRVNVLNFSGLR